MSDVFLGLSDPVIKSKAKDKMTKRTDTKKFTASESLNFGNVSKEISFNNGTEGFFKIRPKALLESTHNPRPDWQINDDWLRKHVKVDFADVFETAVDSPCLVKIAEEDTGSGFEESVTFPTFEELSESPDPTTKDQYEFLVKLAKEIRKVGQIQPIEVESTADNNGLVVLEGHLRRLACILGRVPYIKAIRNEGLHALSQQQKVERQVSENNVRKDISLWGLYLLVEEQLNNEPRLTVRELSSRLRINKTSAGCFKKLYSIRDACSPIIFKAMEQKLIGETSLRKVLTYKQVSAQEKYLRKMLPEDVSWFSDDIVFGQTIIKGSGRLRTVSTFRIKSKDNCIKAGNKLLALLPALFENLPIKEVNSVEDMDLVLSRLEAFLLEE